MGLIFVTQFIVTWEFMIEIQSWHINKLVDTDNYYYYSVLPRHEVKVFSFSLAFLRKFIPKLLTVKHKLSSTPDLYILYGYAKNMWLQLLANIYLMFAIEEERFSWLLEQWSTLQHSKVTPRPVYAWDTFWFQG